MKLVEVCGASVSLRCQLPYEDLDALVSITSDEDLANLIEEYDKSAAAASASPSLKIRAFLSPPKSVKKATSPPSSVSSPSSSSSPSSPFSSVTYSGSNYSSKSSRCPAPVASRYYRSRSPAPPVFQRNSGTRTQQYVYNGSIQSAGNSDHGYLVHNGIHWQ